MKKFIAFVVSLIGFVVFSNIFNFIPWSKFWNDLKDQVASVQSQGDTTARPSPADPPPQEKVPVSSKDNANSYFPPDTPSTLYEYDLRLDALPRAKQLTLIQRVDGVRTINGKSYYKEITEYTGWEDLLEALKRPEIAGDKELKDHLDALKEGLKQSVSYARWDRDGELELDDDDLSIPETRSAPLHADVGAEWSENGIRLKAVSIEDVVIGDETFRDCLKVRASAQGVLIYAARGIGPVKKVYPSKFTATLRKYRR